MFFDNKEKSVNEFARSLVKLAPTEVLGVAKLLKVKLFYDDVKDEKGNPMPKSGESILEECLVRFYSLNRAERRKVLKITRTASVKE